MKKKRFSVEQIVSVLKQAEVGVPVAEVIRKVGISDLLSMEEAIRWHGDRSGSADEATAGREQPIETVGCRSEPG
jgi:hypothetical protein